MYRLALVLSGIALAIPAGACGCGKRPSREGPHAEPAAHAPAAGARDTAASRTLPEDAPIPAAPAVPAAPAGDSDSEMVALAGALVDAARALRAALGETGARTLTLPWDGDARRRWYYTPRQRAGVALGDMNDEQAAATRALLAVALSQRGRDKVEDILTLEGILGRVEGNPGFRDPGRYHVMLFGAPSSDAPWSWRFEGHHLSINLTQVGDAVASTRVLRRQPRPGAQRSARRHAGPGRRGGRCPGAVHHSHRGPVVARAHRRARAGRSRHRQRFARPPGTLRGPAGQRAHGRPARPPVGPGRGLYTGNLHPALARAHRARIERAGVGQLHIAWAGSSEPGRAHYYRVHGPTHLIEYDNRGGNHIHAVFRDLEGDFGEDLLARHLRAHPHPAPDTQTNNKTNTRPGATPAAKDDAR